MSGVYEDDCKVNMNVILNAPSIPSPLPPHHHHPQQPIAMNVDSSNSAAVQLYMPPEQRYYYPNGINASSNYHSSLFVVPQIYLSSHSLVPPLNLPPSSFQTGLCSCTDDCSTCCIATCLPCYQSARNRNKIDKNYDVMIHSVLTIFLYLFCPPLFICCLAMNRTAIRKHFNIEGDECKDYCTHCCCGSCALTQESLEINKRLMPPPEPVAVADANHPAAAPVNHQSAPANRVSSCVGINKSSIVSSLLLSIILAFIMVGTISTEWYRRTLIDSYYDSYYRGTIHHSIGLWFVKGSGTSTDCHSRVPGPCRLTIAKVLMIIATAATGIALIVSFGTIRNGFMVKYRAACCAVLSFLSSICATIGLLVGMRTLRDNYNEPSIITAQGRLMEGSFKMSYAIPLTAVAIGLSFCVAIFYCDRSCCCQPQSDPEEHREEVPHENIDA